MRFCAAAGQIDIGAAQALADIDGGEPRGLQPVGIERHQNLALDTADTLDLGDVAHALQRALDDVVDEIGKLLGRLAGRDRGDVGRGQPSYREFGKADPAQHQEDDGEYDRGKRVPDRPCRDIQSHQRTRVRSRSSANMVLIWSPSCSEEPASATTISPSSRPSRISVELSLVSPTRTLRVSTIFPLTT